MKRQWPSLQNFGQKKEIVNNYTEGVGFDQCFFKKDTKIEQVMVIKEPPKRCSLKLYICQGPPTYGGVQTTLEPSSPNHGAPWVPTTANLHSKLDDYERLFVYDEKNKDYPYKFGLENSGGTSKFEDEAEISNSDITQYENGKDLNKIFVGEFEKLNQTFTSCS